MSSGFSTFFKNYGSSIPPLDGPVLEEVHKEGDGHEEGGHPRRPVALEDALRLLGRRPHHHTALQQARYPSFSVLKQL
jgi:hypothetical protein